MYNCYLGPYLTCQTHQRFRFSSICSLPSFLPPSFCNWSGGCKKTCFSVSGIRWWLIEISDLGGRHTGREIHSRENMASGMLYLLSLSPLLTHSFPQCLSVSLLYRRRWGAKVKQGFCLPTPVHPPCLKIPAFIYPISLFSLPFILFLKSNTHHCVFIPCLLLHYDNFCIQ